MMKRSLLFLVAFCLGQVMSECDEKNCHNYYYNCIKWDHVPTDRPNEVIDCSTDKYKLRCPLLCEICLACDFVTSDELDDEMDQAEKEAEDKLKDLERQFEDDLEDLKDEQENKLAEMEKEAEDDLEELKK